MARSAILNGMVDERIGRLRVRMLALSFLMLFVELALIRWTGSNIVYLSYFSNFVLLASFLGIGLGFLRADARYDLFRFAPIALAVLIAFVRIFPVQIDRSGTELIFFGALGTQSGLPPWLTLPVLFLGVGLPGDRIHAPNERMVMDQFWKGLLAAGELWTELARG